MKSSLSATTMTTIVACLLFFVFFWNTTTSTTSTLSFVHASLLAIPVQRTRATTTTRCLHLATASSSSCLETLRIAIVGAGPSGLLLAHGLLRHGAAAVHVYEARSDPRSTTTSSNRAYALGVGIRGRTAIQQQSHALWEAVKKRGYESERFVLMLSNGISIPLRDGAVKRKRRENKDLPQQQPSVLLYQTDLCAALLDELESTQRKSNLKITFQQAITSIETNHKQQPRLLVQQQDDNSFYSPPYDLIVGCDGVNSIVRKTMSQESPSFECTLHTLPGEFKVCRLDASPPLMDPTSVTLLLPKMGSTTAFIEPTIHQTSCVLFAGNSDGTADDPILNAITNNDNNSTTDCNATATAILERFPKLQGSNLQSMAEQLTQTEASRASSVQCNVYHHTNNMVLCGDAAHATGGVSGQGVNSALVDAAVLVECLTQHFNQDTTSSNDSDTTTTSKREASLRKALLDYSNRQVPEGKALYDLSFGPSPKGLWKRLLFVCTNIRDFVFQGRRIGKPPLQTELTTSLKSFSEIRRERAAFYEEVFPTQEEFERCLEEISS